MAISTTFPSAAQLPGLAYTVKWSPTFQNLTQITQSGAAIQIALSPYPLHEFELTFAFLRDYTSPSEFKRLMGFFLAVGGSAGRFLFTNVDDFTVTGQVIATSDGVTDVWPMIRTFGIAGSPSGIEPVGQVFSPSTAVNVYYNTGGGPVLKTYGTDYVIDQSFPGNNGLDLMTIPGAGAVITADFTYFYYCRFSDDSMTFEKFVNQVWSGQSVKLTSCLAGT